MSTRLFCGNFEYDVALEAVAVSKAPEGFGILATLLLSVLALLCYVGKQKNGGNL